MNAAVLETGWGFFPPEPLDLGPWSPDNRCCDGCVADVQEHPRPSLESHSPSDPTRCHPFLCPASSPIPSPPWPGSVSTLLALRSPGTAYTAPRSAQTSAATTITPDTGRLSGDFRTLVLRVFGVLYPPVSGISRLWEDTAAQLGVLPTIQPEHILFSRFYILVFSEMSF